MDTSSEIKIPVVAAVIRRGNRYLVCKRPVQKRHGGLWEFPGGKIHPGESVPEAIERELREELDLTAAEILGEPLLDVRDPASPFVILFVETKIRGNPQALEHDAIGWFQATELIQLDLAPADRQFVIRVLLGERGD